MDKNTVPVAEDMAALEVSAAWQIQCATLQGQVYKMSSQIDELCKELVKEQEWSHLLAVTLSKHSIAYDYYNIDR